MKKDAVLFLRFLKERGVYKLFLKEFYTKNAFLVRLEYNLPGIINEYLDNVWNERFLTYAFTWGLTVNGFSFWNGISCLWVKELEKNKKNDE